MKGKRGQVRGHKKAQNKTVAIIPGTAVLIARLSSEDQRKKGFGLDDQTKAGQDYAERLGLRLVMPPLQLVESAYNEDDREQFSAYMDAAEAMGVAHYLFAKLDRSLRNLADLARLEKMARTGRTLHCFLESFVYHQNSPAGDLWRLGIQGVAAVAESRQISERTRRALKAKALAGDWPQRAIFGYRNVGVEGEKKSIEPDPIKGHWHVRIKELSASARYSIDVIIEKLKGEGCTVPLTRNLIERVIRSPFATGRYQWEGEWCQGKHKPLISWDLHLAAVAGLERLNKPKYRQHDWPYAGLIQCALCGRAIVFETKKKTLKDGGVNEHTYAHCTGLRSSPDRRCARCVNENLKLAELEEALGNVVRPISMKREIVDHLLDKIAAGADHETLAKETELATVRREIAKLGTYIERAYTDKMEGKINEDFWQQQTARWQEQRIVLQEKVKALETSGPDSRLTLARRVLEPTISLADKYFSMDPHKRASILRITCSNLKQDQKKIVPTYRTIYGFLVRGNDSGNWLRD